MSGIFTSNTSSKLKKIILPAVEGISDNTFDGLSSLEEIYINSSVAPQIGASAFNGIKPGGVLHYYQDADSFNG